MDKSEFFGEWWIPEYPEEKYIGRINIDHNSSSVLEINGRFGIDSPDIILGINHEGEKITLIENYADKYSFSKTELCVYESHTVIFSKHFDSIDSIKIKSLNVYFDGLEEWTCFNSIERKMDVENKTLTITTKSFNEKELFTNESYSIKIHNKCNWLQNAFPYRNVNLRQSDFFIITLEKEETLNHIYSEILIPLRLFLTFGMSNPTDFKTIIAHDIDNASFEIDYCKPNIKRDVNKKKYNMLFDLSKIISNFDYHYGKWLELIKRIAPIHYYYFEVLKHLSAKHFSDRDFWTITVALESLHRCIYDGIDTEETEKVYQEHLEILKNKLSSSEYEEISKNLLKPSEMNLRKRLESYLKKFKKFSVQFFRNRKDRESFIYKITQTRHFQTHLDISKNYDTVDDNECFDYIWLMLRLFELSILESMGFNEDKILELFKNYAEYKIIQTNFMDNISQR